ncbi:hypothetical protein ACQCSX_19675 [Pseudarthrobacter sp. P1]|uniref:hypothetical protein n=1 Tax=Pseudarthrobacter sp. P1 TaxID=3418418 RepID=UPI003CF01BED
MGPTAILGLPLAYAIGQPGSSWVPLLLVALAVVLRLVGRANRRNVRRHGGPSAGTWNRQPGPGVQPPDVRTFDAGYRPPPADFEPLGPEQPLAYGPEAPDVPGPAPAPRAHAGDRLAAGKGLKARLDALDARCRTGSITAEQYAAAREEMFRNH